VNVLKPNQRATVFTLLERNTPQREIARITGIDRKTIRSYHARWLLDPSNSPGVATGSEAVAPQIPPPWPPALVSTSSSLCEVHRDFIEAQLLLRRNAMAIYQDLVDAQGLMHRCVMLEFEGKSYRLKEAAARLAIQADAS
jgi:hypothetical protein